MKERTNVTIDEDLLKKARQVGLNISGELEAALKKKLMSVEANVPKEQGEKCSDCGKAFRRQTADDIRNNSCDKALIWLCPEEVWICESCLNHRKRIITRIAQ